MRYRPEDFEPDGALRDVVVRTTTTADWERMLAALSGSEFEFSFETDIDGVGPELPADLSAIWSDLNGGEHSARLVVRSGGIWFRCYFFDDEEIEFTFDPDDVPDEDRFADLERFLRWLGDSCGKQVVMTMESASGHDESLPALLSYEPS